MVTRESSLKFFCVTTIKIRGGDGNVVSPDPLLAKNNTETRFNKTPHYADRDSVPSVIEDVCRRRNRFNLMKIQKRALTKHTNDKLNEKLEEARQKFFDRMAAVTFTLINARCNIVQEWYLL